MFLVNNNTCISWSTLKWKWAFRAGLWCHTTLLLYSYLTVTNGLAFVLFLRRPVWLSDLYTGGRIWPNITSGPAPALSALIEALCSVLRRANTLVLGPALQRLCKINLNGGKLIHRDVRAHGLFNGDVSFSCSLLLLFLDTHEVLLKMRVIRDILLWHHSRSLHQIFKGWSRFEVKQWLGIDSFIQ